MPPDEELIEAAPCPSCRSPLTVAVADLGHLVECPSCGTRFRARRPETAPSPPPPPRRDRERERSWDDGERDRDRGDYDDDRPRGRSRFDDRDYDDRDRPQRGTPGCLMALAVMNFVYAGLLLICGLLGAIGLAFVEELRAQGGPDPNMPLEVALVVGYFATGLVMLFAGVFALKRQGKGLCATAIALAVVLLLLGLVNGVLNIQQVNRMGPQPPGTEVGMACGVGLLVLFWLGYIITCGLMLSRAGRYFR